MADPTVFVPAPNRRPRLGGIFAVADVVDVPRLGAAAAVEWISDPCDFPKETPGECWGDQTGDATKTPEGIETLQSGQAFTLYAGVECYLGPDADYDERARRALQQGRDRAIESKLNTLLQSMDTTPEVFTTYSAVLHAVEGWGDANYLGRPTIVMDRGNALRAGELGAVEWDREGNIWTPNGTPVLASGNTSTILTFVTGQITVYQTPVTVTIGQGLNSNREMAIAEQTFAIGIDCNYVEAAQWEAAP